MYYSFKYLRHIWWHLFHRILFYFILQDRYKKIYDFHLLKKKKTLILITEFFLNLSYFYLFLQYIVLLNILILVSILRVSVFEVTKIQWFSQVKWEMISNLSRFMGLLEIIFFNLFFANHCFSCCFPSLLFNLCSLLQIFLWSPTYEHITLYSTLVHASALPVTWKAFPHLSPSSRVLTILT